MVLTALVIGIILIVVGGIVNRIKYEGGYAYQVVGDRAVHQALAHALASAHGL